jgi:hypothetical protein
MAINLRKADFAAQLILKNDYFFRESRMVRFCCFIRRRAATRRIFGLWKIAACPGA